MLLTCINLPELIKNKYLLTVITILFYQPQQSGIVSFMFPKSYGYILHCFNCLLTEHLIEVKHFSSRYCINLKARHQLKTQVTWARTTTQQISEDTRSKHNFYWLTDSESNISQWNHQVIIRQHKMTYLMLGFFICFLLGWVFNNPTKNSILSLLIYSHLFLPCLHKSVIHS